MNIYELFPERCCVTWKLFILVSVGPHAWRHGRLIKWMQTVLCEGHLVYKHLSLSCLSCESVSPLLLAFVSQPWFFVSLIFLFIFFFYPHVVFLPYSPAAFTRFFLTPPHTLQ